MGPKELYACSEDRAVNSGNSSSYYRSGRIRLKLLSVVVSTRWRAWGCSTSRGWVRFLEVGCVRRVSRGTSGDGDPIYTRGHDFPLSFRTSSPLKWASRWERRNRRGRDGRLLKGMVMRLFRGSIGVELVW